MNQQVFDTNQVDQNVFDTNPQEYKLGIKKPDFKALPQRTKSIFSTVKTIPNENPSQKRKVAGAPNIDDETVINIDKMFAKKTKKSRKQNVDDPDDPDEIGEEEEEKMDGNDSALLQETAFEENPGISQETVVEETTRISPVLETICDDIADDDVIKFLDKDDILGSFLVIFQDADPEEKMSVIGQLMSSCLEDVQDKIMKHLFIAVRKRKLATQSQTENQNSSGKITKKVAADIMLKTTQPSAAPNPVSTSLSKSRQGTSQTLLVCDCSFYRTMSQEKLKNHIEAVHGSEIIHDWQICGECEHKFKYWDDLKLHIGKSHKDPIFQH